MFLFFVAWFAVLTSRPQLMTGARTEHEGGSWIVEVNYRGAQGVKSSRLKSGSLADPGASNATSMCGLMQ